MTDSEDECLQEMLGGIDFNVKWQEEEKDSITKLVVPGRVKKAPPKKKERSSPVATFHVVRPVQHKTQQQQKDDSSIFGFAYKYSGYCTPDSRAELPPLQVVNLGEERGNGLIVTEPIPRGGVIYTERAAVATQLAEASIGACQYCFRSLEPISTLSEALPCPLLWPIPPLEDWTRTNKEEGYYDELQFDKHGRVQCLKCQTMCCTKQCHSKLCDEYGSCCVVQKIRQEVFLTTKVGEPTQPPVALAARFFGHCVQFYRIHDQSLQGHFLEGFCGSADDLNPLELGTLLQDGRCTLAPLYKSLTTILQLSTDEKQVFSLELLHGLASKAGRNGFGMLTQSPFKTYYAGLLRKTNYGGRDSAQHQEHMHQVAQALLGTDELKRGMDRDIESRVAPEICAVFPLTARCNHSCDPNAEVRSQEFVDARIDVVARRGIATGEELYISYIGVGGDGMGRKPTNRRRRELQAKYLFVCSCSLCAGNIAF